MYHQNLSGRRFTNLTFELLYETPRQFTSPFSASGGLRSPKEGRPTFVGRSVSRGSSRSSSSGSSINLKRRHASQTHAPMPVNATSKIAAAAFAEEKERIEREAREAREAAEKEEVERERGRRKERVSNATTIHGGEVVHDIGMDELKKEIGGPLPGTFNIDLDEEEEEGEQAARDRKSSATLSIVLNELEKEMKGERSRAPAPTDMGHVGEYTENVENRIPNVPYKSVTHPDVAQPRTDDLLPAGADRALVKPSWRKQPLEKISEKTHRMKQKIDVRTTSIREKIPFFKNGSTMDRIKETFKFSRFTNRN
ncbi:hypothetical protein TWF173_011419 [Orbilia oligospora]|uniref:Uncharacterized protein n=1 Tax=Orbilia oligospora TaxID=2813651 RepID=A0A7C8RDD0_ORBOL|nr:hypothetical protein TWF970_010430 [Orbilia oligospora]KAF3309114.1 hypothetical protein TWF173_011419 [Orbilia oligospora]